MDIFLLLGIATALGIAGAKAVQRIKVPQVVGYILIGVILGSSVLNIISLKTAASLEVISSLALAFIGFTIGGELAYTQLKELGKSATIITFFEASTACILVLIAVLLLTKSLPIALIFGALASATAPAATVDVLWEYRSKGPLTTTLFAVVGMDDAMALIIYAVASSFAKLMLTGEKTFSLGFVLGHPLFEIFGSLITGALLAVILHYLLRYIKRDSEVLIVVIGAIFLCSGVATTFDFSLILANMALGVTLINLSARNRPAFEAISRLTPPIFLLFFVLVGARLQLGLLSKLGLLGIIYILMRVTGKSLGAYIGAILSSAPATVRKYLGFGLLSQAGVAIGLAIDASHTFARYGAQGAHVGLLAINVIAGTTFIFQILGPPFTKYAIFRAGEVAEEFKTLARSPTKP